MISIAVDLFKNIFNKSLQKNVVIPLAVGPRCIFFAHRSARLRVCETATYQQRIYNADQLLERTNGSSNTDILFTLWVIYSMSVTCHRHDDVICVSIVTLCSVHVRVGCFASFGRFVARRFV